MKRKEKKAKGLSFAEASRRIYASDNYFYMLFSNSASNKISEVKARSIETNLGIPYENFKCGEDELSSVRITDVDIRKVIESKEFEDAVRIKVLKVMKEVMEYGL